MKNETSQTDFSTFMLDDFDNPDFCKTYLAEHDAEMTGANENDGLQIFTFHWSKGFMAATPLHWGEYYANLWGCVFIYLWKYKGVKLPDADVLTGNYVSCKYKNEVKS